MKRIFISLIAIIITTTILAQTPQKISYQAVIRNSSNILVTNTQIGMQVTILKGSTTGTPVYVETKTPTTNANGLVSIEIGGGTGFDTINWSNDNYFIKTQTAVVAPLTTYTITGISQLLSVPYALHAKTAESISGGIIETDPIFIAWDKDYSDLTNKPVNATTTVDGFMSSGDKAKLDTTQNVNIMSGYGINVSGTYPNISVGLSNRYYVGQLIGTNGEDGIVFYVDETGQHGLICSANDLDGGSGVAWSNITTTPAPAFSHFNGFLNTVNINAQSTSSAASLCYGYSTSGTTAGNWYLPSIDELSLLYHAKYSINKALNTNSFTLGMYWSSTEYATGTVVWCYSFVAGSSDAYSKSTTSYKVRAIRAF